MHIIVMALILWLLYLALQPAEPPLDPRLPKPREPGRIARFLDATLTVLIGLVLVIVVGGILVMLVTH